MRKTWSWTESPTENNTDVQAETLKSLARDMVVDMRQLTSTPLYPFLFGLKAIAADNKQLYDKVIRP